MVMGEMGTLKMKMKMKVRVRVMKMLKMLVGGSESSS